VKRITPVVRISMGLAILTCSLLIMLDLLGLIPRPADGLVDSRLRLCETLAAQAAAGVGANDLSSARAALRVAVRRNDDVLSAGMRTEAGRLLLVVGDHRALWDPEQAEQATAKQVSIPLFEAGKRWGSVEVRFKEPNTHGVLELISRRPLLRLLLLVAVGGFASYLVYMRRTLKHLDPSAVIPGRVQAALDVMAEGVILLDEKERIVLANASFAEFVGRSPVALLGVKPATLDWRAPGSDEPPRVMPWTQAMRDAEAIPGTPLIFAADSDDLRSFIVKGAPVLDGFGRAKGAIATFDDVTELEKRSAELQAALVELEKSRDEIRLQNDELQVLAKTDPLTGCSNRRFFMETYETHFAVSLRGSPPFSCLMVDIDFFKRVNDEHGHGVGDEVIQRVAEAMKGAVRSSDAVCRYGGEEFCVALPVAEIEAGAMVGERIRAKVASPGFARVPVTVSVGVASVGFGATTLQELIGQADEALYASKHGGRNQVTRWDQLEPKAS
jgi:diguanylate cyclase (GGDEF)-like protein